MQAGKQTNAFLSLQKLKKQLKTGQVQIASDLKKLKKNLSKGDWARVVKTLKEGVRKGAKKAPKEINANAYIRDADKFIDKIK